MDINFDINLADTYKNQSQIIRVLTESWACDNIYCPHCGYHKILHFPNNQAVADFYCPKCKNEYELKSKKGSIGHKITDGAYDIFIQRITSNNNPDFFILSYNAHKLCVENLIFVPKYFFVPEIIEKRKPLSDSAQRAGWVGCNILFDKIPIQGQISIIQNGTTINKDSVIAQVQHSNLLNTSNIGERGWLLDVLYYINEIPKSIFSLEDIYSFENQLHLIHPQNNNIRPKIRQQLQILRNKGFLDFLGNGFYRKK